MILREKVTVTRRVSTGARDDFGNYIYEDVPEDLRAEVSPMQSDEVFTGGTQFASSRLRVVLAATATNLNAIDSLTWRGKAYTFDGSPLPHVIGGRIHHHEVIVKAQQ